MKGQKQSKADLQEKKIQALINVVQRILDENAYLRDLSVGTLETIKCMPDYDKAIKTLEEQVKTNKKEDNGVKQQDTK